MAPRLYARLNERNSGKFLKTMLLSSLLNNVTVALMPLVRPVRASLVFPG